MQSMKLAMIGNSLDEKNKEAGTWRGPSCTSHLHDEEDFIEQETPAEHVTRAHLWHQFFLVATLHTPPLHWKTTEKPCYRASKEHPLKNIGKQGSSQGPREFLTSKLSIVWRTIKQLRHDWIMHHLAPWAAIQNDELNTETNKIHFYSEHLFLVYTLDLWSIKRRMKSSLRQPCTIFIRFSQVKPQ